MTHSLSHRRALSDARMGRRDHRRPADDNRKLAHELATMQPGGIRMGVHLSAITAAAKRSVPSPA